MPTRMRRVFSRAPVSKTAPRSSLPDFRDGIRAVVTSRPEGSDIATMARSLADAGLQRRQFDYLIESLADQGWIIRQGDMLYPGRNPKEPR